MNLSARYMQKAISYAIDLSKMKKRKENYMILIDQRTKDVIISENLVNTK